ncbi:MAG: hypothetical protein HZC02_01440 [Candidatus Levybacteria bacterium]|nr:hypothetical protein [Candidatus Levybacteria bacterium]
MTATGHALLGVALAAAIPNPLIGIPTAIISHVAADAFPHWDTGTNLKRNNPKSKKTKLQFVIQSYIDLGVSFVLPYTVMQIFFPHLNILYGYSMIIAAQLFDWLAAPYIFLDWKFPPFSWVSSLQKMFDHRLDKPWGIIGQVAIIAFFLYVAILV